MKRSVLAFLLSSAFLFSLQADDPKDKNVSDNVALVKEKTQEVKVPVLVKANETPASIVPTENRRQLCEFKNWLATRLGVASARCSSLKERWDNLKSWQQKGICAAGGVLIGFGLKNLRRPVHVHYVTLTNPGDYILHVK